MSKRIIDESLLDEIDEKVALLHERGQDCKISRQTMHIMNQDALYHSGLIELDGADRFAVKEGKKDFREANSSMQDAWRYGETNFDGVLSHSLLLKIAGIIDERNVGYRTNSVRMSNLDSVSPINPAKVYFQLERLMSYVNGTDLHPVESAALFHLHFARIHPLVDGNGRVSRLVQNLILNQEGYVPVNILSGERSTYQRILRDGLVGFSDRESQFSIPDEIDFTDVSRKESNFFDYIGSKVNISADGLIDIIDRLPHHKVFLPKANPGQVFALKRTIDSYFRKRGQIGQARIVDKSGQLEVVADIDRSCMDSLVSASFKGKYKIK